MNEATILEPKPARGNPGRELATTTTAESSPRRRGRGNSGSFTLMCVLLAVVGLLAVKTEAELAGLDRLLEDVKQDLERGFPVVKASTALTQHAAH